MNRQYPNSPVCAVGALIFQGKKILLVRRGKSPSKGKWSLPGGRLRLGEPLKAGVIREIKEETQLLVKPIEIGKVVEHIIKDKEGKVEYHYVIVDYICQVVKGIPQASSDVIQVEFVPISQLEHLNLTSGTAQVILEVFDSVSRSKHSSQPSV